MVQVVKLPKLHKDLLVISLLHYSKIRKAYSEILGLNAIDHLSINMVNPEGEIVFLSSTPATGQNICAGNLWHYDFSIHPQVYENQPFYWWHNCYAEGMQQLLKSEKETKNNLSYGFVFSQKTPENFHILYSFATREADPEVCSDIEQHQNLFIAMGEHCYNLVRPIYEQYAGAYAPPVLKKPLGIQLPQNH